MNISQKKNTLALGLLTFAWAGAIVLVNPLGDFPLNDDFSFARSVFNLSERGVLEFDKWLDMTLITQVLWGAGFAKIFGFSFEVLRFSNLIAAFLAVLGCYFTSRDLGQGRRASMFAGLAVGFSPILFSLSFTFMSDVPFFALCVWSVFAFNRAFASGKIRWVLLGSLLAIAATFIRQLGFMLPAAFAAAWFFRGKTDWKSLLTATLPLAVTTLLYVRYTAWFEASQGLPSSYGTVSKLFGRLGNGDFGWVCFYRLGMLAGYLGLFLLPLVLAVGKFSFWEKPWWGKRTFTQVQRAALFALLGIFLLSLAPAWGKVFWGNIFYNFGLGPKVLKDGQFFVNVLPQLNSSGVFLVKFFFTFSGILLIVSLLPQFFLKLKNRSPYFPAAVFASANIMLYGGFLLLDLKFFDRYFFQLLPFLLVFLLPQIPQEISRRRLAAACLGLAVVASFSIAATHDYLAWNRARWQALGHLTEKMKISPGDIDGGFEFNGWHRPVPERTYGGGKSWWWVKNDDFAVTFGGMKGHSIVRGFPYLRYLPPGVDSVFILRKNEEK